VSYSFEAKLWSWNGGGPTSWFFVTVPQEISFAIRCEAARRAWGSVAVKASIGATQWQTSLFPHKASEGYLLPVKATVRKAEGLREDDVASVTLTLA
jgi:hypothetical protein